MLSSICDIFSPSGKENKMQDYLKNQLAPLFDKIEVDPLGNVTAQKGKPFGFALECGMDTLGVMIVSKSEGKAFFAGVGGINAEYLNGKKIVFENGEFGIVRCDGKLTAETKLSDLYLEMDTEHINVGDFGVLDAGFSQNSTKIFANGIGDRVAIMSVVSALKKANLPQNLCVVFTAQRRIGGKGLRAFFGANTFKNIVTVDGITNIGGVKSGNGCAVIAVDGREVSNPIFRGKIEKLADENNIKYQKSVTDENLCIEFISTSGVGAVCCALGIPVGYKGKAYESVEKSDLDSTTELIKKLIENADAC